uniref:C2H2-type domain-containing protein n=1 Tax=Pseudonaja textilis TaxID=8673 RepID=A0A670ZNY4_PSETE
KLLSSCRCPPWLTEPGNLGQFSPLPVSSEQDVSPSSEEGLVPVDGRTGALQLLTESGGDVTNFTTFVVQEGRTHMVAKKPVCYICGQCSRTFNRHSNFLRHQMIHTREQPYTCGECGKTFIRKEHLATHGRLYTGKWPYQCPLCLKSFTRKQHLVGHQCLHEGETEGQIWSLRPMEWEGTLEVF